MGEAVNNLLTAIEIGRTDIVRSVLSALERSELFRLSLRLGLGVGVSGSATSPSWGRCRILRVPPCREFPFRPSAHARP